MICEILIAVIIIILIFSIANTLPRASANSESLAPMLARAFAEENPHNTYIPTKMGFWPTK